MMPQDPGTKSDPHQTPAMKQFHRFKQQHPGCVLLFRMGDFYELFYDDAELAHHELGVSLTQRTQGIPMAGVPYHAVESYLRRLIEAGHRVAVCDQMEDPAQAKGVVERDVTRVLTPGTLTDETLLDDSRENPLAAVRFLGEGAGEVGGKGGGAGAGEHVALGWVELSTGAFWVCVLGIDAIADELARIGPSELLFCQTADGTTPPRVKAVAQGLGCVISGRPPWQFRQNEAVEAVCRQFGVAQLGGFGFEHDDPALAVAGAIVHYLLETQRAGGWEQNQDSNGTRRLGHLRPPRRFERSDHMVIDQTSLRSLEVDATIRGARTEGSLLGILGAGPWACVTSMGKRTLRDWLCYPLCNREQIEKRQNLVQAMVDDSHFLNRLREVLKGVQDVQRISARLSVGRALPRDLVALGKSVERIGELERLLSDNPSTAEHHRRVSAMLEPLNGLGQHLGEACVDEPPGHMRNGGLIRTGFDRELDDQRRLQSDSHDWLARYQKTLIERTDIPTLKVGFNKVFGYYIEVTKAQRDKLEPFIEGRAQVNGNDSTTGSNGGLATEPGMFPDQPAKASNGEGWARKQTLKNAERFVTPELKDFEGRVLSAQTRAIAREQALFDQLCQQAQQQVQPLHAFAELVAELDVLGCFAGRAVRSRYVRPRIVDEPILNLTAARHPVLDETLADRFVPNDLGLEGRKGPRGEGAAKGPKGQGAKGPRGAEEEESLTELSHADASPACDAAPTNNQQSNDHQQTATSQPRAPVPLGPLAPSPPSLCLITGPNMAGKSTYIRQAALITLLAHTGSFVPAESATIGLTDRIFTRIGASDELHAGQSTFMVEMTETANLCHHATPSSLVILDEIGRGTSTLDGLALAWAVAEHLAQAGPRSLFATHYHEVTALAEDQPNVGNLSVAVREWQDQIVFLHRINQGAADRSYGIHVARIAGVPQPIIERATTLLGQLAVSHHEIAPQPQGHPQGPASEANQGSNAAQLEPSATGQEPLFADQPVHPVIEQLRALDMDGVSPMQAFDTLRKLKSEINH